MRAFLNIAALALLLVAPLAAVAQEVAGPEPASEEAVVRRATEPDEAVAQSGPSVDGGAPAQADSAAKEATQSPEAASEEASGEADAQPEQAWERYKLIVERNIFLRNRSRPVRRTIETVRRAAPTPERSTVLTGTLRRGEEWIAFVEDLRTGVTSSVRAGEPLLRGRLAAVALDYIEYELDGQTVQVKVGDSLAGGSPGVSDMAEGSGPDESAPTGADAGRASPTAGPGSAADILEQMRQRRRRELGR